MQIWDCHCLPQYAMCLFLLIELVMRLTDSCSPQERSQQGKRRLTPAMVCIPPLPQPADLQLTSNISQC